MDEKEKEEAGETINAETTEAVEETNEETATKTTEETADEAVSEVVNEGVTESVNEPTEIKKNKKLRNALIRVGVALLVAIALLGLTKLSVVDLIKGAKESDAVQDEKIGSFVKRDVFAIVGFVDAKSDEATATDTTTETVTPASSTSGEYALVPMGGKFVTVHFTKRYLESAYAIEKGTYDYINGSVSTLDSYVKVEGTTEKISDELSTKMYDWFALNKDWMVQAGVIAATDDNATYLSDTIFEVDTVNGMSDILVLVLTGLAALCLLYIIVELVLMAAGVYMDGSKKKKPEIAVEQGFYAENVEELAVEQEASENTEKVEEKSAEDCAECIKGEENSENNCCSETEITEKSDGQEEKI